MIDEQKDLPTPTDRRVARPSTWARVEPGGESESESAGVRAAWYVGTAALSLLIVAILLQVWRADPDVPLQYAGDALLHQLYIKAMLDHGWYLHNAALGAPFAQDLHDFPLVDSLHFVLVKAAALVSGGSFGRATNAYFLLTFPLVSVSALISMRRLGARFGPAAVAAQLFAFLPYHFFRGEGHLFLAAYFLIPPTAVLAVRIYLDPETLPGRSGRRPIGLAGLATCLMVGSAGAYYAFFSCYLLAIAGLSAALRRRSTSPLIASGLGVGLIVLGALANFAPKFLYDRAHGPNPLAVQRSAAEAEVLGLRMAQLLMPIPDHRLPILADARARWSAELPSLQGYYQFSTLGLISSLGVLLLLGRSLKGPRSPRPTVLDGLAMLNIFVLVLALSGGLGAFLGIVVSPWVRAYERFSVFVAFFALAALALIASRPRPVAASIGRNLARGVALAGVLVLGVLDQTNASFVPFYEPTIASYRSDDAFVGRIEKALPPGSMVFQIPSIGFPEVVDIQQMTCYDAVRPYLHSKRLKWSHGAVKGSLADGWRTRLATLAPEPLARVLALAGFEGIHVDRAGYADRGADVEAQLARITGSAPWTSPDGRYTFFPLASYRSALRNSMTEADWIAGRSEALRPNLVTWGPGFDIEEIGPEGPFHWAGKTGTLVLHNPGASPRSATLAMRAVIGVRSPSTLRVESPVWTEDVAVPGPGLDIRKTLTLPPGTTLLKLSSDAPLLPLPAPATRRLVFQIRNATLKLD